MEPVSGFARPPSWSYHSEEGYCEQKIMDGFPLRRCKISKIVFCSLSLGFSSSHSSIISNAGFVYFSIDFVKVLFSRVISSSISRSGKRIAWLMVDRDIACVRPSSVYNILKRNGLFPKWVAPAEAKKKGFFYFWSSKRALYLS